VRGADDFGVDHPVVQLDVQAFQHADPVRRALRGVTLERSTTQTGRFGPLDCRVGPWGVPAHGRGPFSRPALQRRLVRRL